jgi:hypothetical protein
MKTTITIPLNDRDPVEVEATIVAGVMAVHQQEWDESPKWVVSHIATGMTFGILWLTSEQDAIEAAHMAAQSEAILDALAGKTRDECLDRTGDLFHPAIQAINQAFHDREVEQAKAEHARLVESGAILSPEKLMDLLRDDPESIGSVEHFDEVLELVEQASVEVQHKIVQALIDGNAGHGELAVYEGYAEPGYDDPAYLVLVDNWNQYGNYGREMEKLLEACGCAIEWSDEWYDCQQCYKLVRTSADCYSWTPSYVMLNECEPVCHECMEDEDMQRDYVESELEGECGMADTIGLDLEGLGYTRLDEDFQNGWYGGQCADPHKIGEALNKREITRFVFQIDSVGQFESRFSCWVHDDDMPEDELDLGSSETDGVDPAKMMAAGLKDASEKMSKLSGEGVKVATCNADGTADVRLVSGEDFIAGNSIDRQ